MRVIAYTFDADVHCPGCTSLSVNQADHNDHDADDQCPGCLQNAQTQGMTLGSDLDEHGIPYEATDREGNRIRPIFTTDELLRDLYCGDCRGLIAAA